jgi:hypothetical protein
MADKAILLPANTRAALAELVRAQNEIGARINAIVATARECLSVPEGYTLRDVERGFEPPAEQPAGDGGLE